MAPIMMEALAAIYHFTHRRQTSTTCAISAALSAIGKNGHILPTTAARNASIKHNPGSNIRVTAAGPRPDPAGAAIHRFQQRLRRRGGGRRRGERIRRLAGHHEHVPNKVRVAFPFHPERAQIGREMNDAARRRLDPMTAAQIAHHFPRRVPLRRPGSNGLPGLAGWRRG